MNEFSPEDVKHAQARSAESRRAVSKAINMKSISVSRRDEDHGRRQPGEIPNMKTAIRWKCYDCMGWEPDGAGSLLARVLDCECPHCPLYPWRGGQFDKEMIDG